MHLLRRFPPARTRVASSTSLLRTVGRVSAALAFAVAAACSDDPNGSNAISLAVAPNAVTTTPGAPGVVTVTVGRGSGFTGDVTLAAQGLPAGVSATFNPATISGSATSTSMSLVAATSAAAGTSTITVIASGSGAKPKSVQVQVTVNAASVTLSAGATTITTTQGATPTLGFTIVRNGGFTGPVSLTAQGLPANVSATFNPSTLGTGVTTGTLSLAVASNAAVGTTSFTIRAAGTGIAEQIIPISLVINTGAQPDFTLAATPASVSVAPGGIATTNIAINRTAGFQDNVGFQTSGVPAGVVPTFTPNPSPNNTVQLALATTTQAIPGTYTITITGQGGLVAPRTTTVMLTINPPPGLTLALNPQSTSLSAGGSVTNTLTVTRVGGFAGDIAFSATSVASGFTVTFAPATISGAAASTSTATITAAANMAPGFYTMNMVATGVGTNITSIVPINITVTAPNTIGLSVPTPSITLAPGTSGSINATISRGGGFTGAVNVAVSGLPAGVTATVTPASLSGATTTAAVNLTVGASTGTGTYNGTITASGTGVTSVSQNFSVVVSTGPGAGGGTIRWQFCSSTGLPVFFAFKDGSTGAWTRVQPNASNLYSFDVTKPQAGALVVKTNLLGGFDTRMYLMTATELDAVANGECTVSQPGFKTLTGSVVALGATETAQVNMGGASLATLLNTGSLNYTLNNVLNGAQDLVAIRYNAGATDKILIRRNLNLNSGSVIAPLDFASAEAFAPEVGTVSLGNLQGDLASLQTFFQTQNGGSAALAFSPPSTLTDRSVVGVPGVIIAGSDRHLQAATATSFDGSSIRNVFTYTGGVGGTVTFGAVLNQPTVSSATSTVSRPRAQGAFQSDYPSVITAVFAQTTKNVVIVGTAGYFGGVGYDLEYPDLTNIMQYDPSYGLNRSTSTTYIVTGSDAGAAGPTVGTSYRQASRFGTFTSSAIRR